MVDPVYDDQSYHGGQNHSYSTQSVSYHAEFNQYYQCYLIPVGNVRTRIVSHDGHDFVPERGYYDDSYGEKVQICEQGYMLAPEKQPDACTLVSVYDYQDDAYYKEKERCNENFPRSYNIDPIYIEVSCN